MIKKNAKGEYQVFLAEKMQKVLDDYDKAFVTWKATDFIPSIIKVYDFNGKQAPFAVIGDFNADKVLDAYLYGHNKTKSKTICIMSKGDTFELMLLGEGKIGNPKSNWYGMGRGRKEYGFYVYLLFVAKGELEYYVEYVPGVDVKDNTVILEGDAIEWVVYGKAATVKYYKDG